MTLFKNTYFVEPFNCFKSLRKCNDYASIFKTCNYCIIIQYTRKIKKKLSSGKPRMFLDVDGRHEWPPSWDGDNGPVQRRAGGGNASWARAGACHWPQRGSSANRAAAVLAAPTPLPAPLPHSHQLWLLWVRPLGSLPFFFCSTSVTQHWIWKKH